MKQGILTSIAISSIIVSDQVRHLFHKDDLLELTEDIQEKGVMQPIVINEKEGKYHLVCGERRYRGSSAILSGFTNSKGVKIPGDKKRDMIPANVYKNLTDDEVLDMQIAENLHRKDVHPMEEAASYKRMMDQRKWTVQQVADRVVKSPKYVGLRMKLNNLTPEWQKAFFDEKIDNRDAIELSKLSHEGQAEIFKDKGKNKFIQLSEWDMNKQKRQLQKAPFDIKDAELIKAVGACTTCQHNSGANSLLFPEESGNQMCMNSKCFELKCDLSFQKKIKEAKEDPSTIFISTEWYGSNNDMMKKILAGGDKIYKRDEHERMSKPSKADIESGKVHRALCVQGDEFGKYIYVRIKKKQTSSEGPAKGSAGAFKEKQAKGKVSTADIDAEIKRINDNEKRKQEIDMEKAWPMIHELLNKNKDFLDNKKPLSINEKVILILILEDKIGYSFRDFRKEIKNAIGHGDLYTSHSEFVEWLKKRSDKLDGIIANLSRIFFYSNVSTMFRIKNSDITALDNVIAGYDASGRKKILDQVDADRKKRADKIDAIIKGLKEKKKTVGTPVKKSAKKKGKELGKGLSALLTDAKKKNK